MFSLLDRVIAREVAKLLVLYSIGFLGLMSVAVTVPLIRGGAPLWDVLMFLPNQMAFPATMVLPLALITAILSTIARMREDGELVALMAAGISSIRVVRATFPLVLVTAVVVAWLAHAVMPVAYQNFMSGKASLLRQAIATTVARQEPIYQSTPDERSLEQTTLAAAGTSDNQLQHVFAWRVDKDGQILISYAPQANWSVHRRDAPRPELPEGIPPEAEENLGRPITVEDLGFDPDTQVTTLRLDLRQARLLNYRADPADLWSQRGPEALRIWQATRDEDYAPPEDLPYPVMVGSLPRWSVIFDQGVIGRPDAPEAKRTGQLAFEIQQISSYLAAFKARSQASPQDAIRDMLKAAEEGKEQTLEAAEQGQSNEGKAEGGGKDMAQLAQAIPPQAMRDLVNRSTATLRELQLAYHLRHMLSVAVVAWWLFAAGLALTIPARNRLTAVAIGLLTVIITVIPAFALVKGMGGHLAINPAYLLWGPPLFLALLGLLMLWRNR